MCAAHSALLIDSAQRGNMFAQHTGCVALIRSIIHSKYVFTRLPICVAHALLRFACDWRHRSSIGGARNSFARNAHVRLPDRARVLISMRASKRNRALIIQFPLDIVKTRLMFKMTVTEQLKERKEKDDTTTMTMKNAKIANPRKKKKKGRRRRATV